MALSVNAEKTPMKILALVSSVRDTSRSTTLVNHFLEEMKKKVENVEVTYRDLNKEPVPHFTEPLRKAFFDAPETHDEEAKKANEVSLRLIQELKDADLIIVGTPIYNWTIPSTLKCWIDQVVRLDHTFYTTPTGIEGMLSTPKENFNHEKKVVFVVSSGLTPAFHVTKYLKAVFGFIGLKDIIEIEASYADQSSIPKDAYEKVDAVVDRLAVPAGISTL